MQQVFEKIVVTTRRTGSNSPSLSVSTESVGTQENPTMTEEYKSDDEGVTPRVGIRLPTGTGGLPVPPTPSGTGGRPVPPTGGLIAPTALATSRIFARVPGDIATHAYLDYTMKNDLQLFKDNSVELPTKFDGTVANLKVFTKELRDRVDKAGWKNLIAIPVNGKYLDLLTHYAQITTKRVVDHAKTWAGIRGSREDQNSAMMYQCISASLTASAQLKIVNLQKEYTVNGVQDGIAFFRVLVGKCYVDTTATVEQLQRSLRTLPAFMASVNSNVADFNSYVEDIVSSLEARSVTYTGLITDLYNGYQAASDAKFTKYIESRYDAYLDGREALTANSFMSAAESLYLNRV